MPLYVIAGPIGNLGDITYRGVDYLRSSDLILAEDTRHSRRLLQHYGIDKPMSSYHMHNEDKVWEKWKNEVAKGQKIALLTDAGTPGVSDPGFLLMQACLQEDLAVEILPGPTAFIPALLLSGFALHDFRFMGFIPQKKGKRTFLEYVLDSDCTVACYESPHRLLKTLQMFAELEKGEDRLLSVSREISKKFEEHVHGTALEIISHFEKQGVKGEFVICVEGRLAYLKRVNKNDV